MTPCWLFTTPHNEQVFAHAKLWVEARKAVQIILQRGPDEVSPGMQVAMPESYYVPQGSKVAFVDEDSYQLFLTERPMSLAETRSMFEQLKKDEEAEVPASASSSLLLFPEISAREGRLYVDSKLICVVEGSWEEAAKNLDAALRAWADRAILT